MLPLDANESHGAAALKGILNQVAFRSYLRILGGKTSNQLGGGTFFFSPKLITFSQPTNQLPGPYRLVPCEREHVSV